MKTLNELLSLKGRTCVITGAANGIGSAIAYRFAEAGSDLILLDKDEKNLIKTRESLKIHPVNIRTRVIDLQHKNEIDAFWTEISSIDTDILINNAGIFPFLDFLKLSEPDLDKVMKINLYATLWMCQAFLRKRLKKGGSIINFGSIEAILPFKKDLTHYSLSKIGVLTLTRDLAKEFADKNFRVNAILPGCILTKGTKDSALKALGTFDLKLIKDGYNFKQRVPAGKLGKPDEVAKVVLALASDIGSFMHGAIIPIDGGFLCA